MNFFDVIEINTPNGELQRIKEKNGEQRILWERQGYDFSVFVNGKLIKNPHGFGVNGEALAQYRLFYDTSNSSWSSLTYSTKTTMCNVSVNSSGIFSSTALTWDDTNAKANAAGSQNFVNCTFQCNISGSGTTGKSQKYARGSIILYKNSVPTTKPSDLPSGYYPYIRGIPSAATVVGGSASLEFVWLGLPYGTDLPRRTREDAYAVQSSSVTLKALTSNISVSGLKVTAKSVGVCSLSVTIPKTGSSGVDTLIYRWPIKNS